MSGIPASNRMPGPRLGWRPEEEGAALRTAAGAHATRPSADTRSISRWSITAISPGWRRFTRVLVEESMRAIPTLPLTGGVSELRLRRHENFITVRSEEHTAELQSRGHI